MKKIVNYIRKPISQKDMEKFYISINGKKYFADFPHLKCPTCGVQPDIGSGDKQNFWIESCDCK